MPALVAGIHVFAALQNINKKDADGRDRTGRDECAASTKGMPNV